MTTETEQTHLRMMIDHSGILATLVADVNSIKKVVGNGLGAQLDAVGQKLDEFITHTRTKEFEAKLRESKIDGENWFSRILNKSAGNIVTLVVGVIMISAVTNAGVATAVKTYWSKEPPGQQATILKTIHETNSALSGYHVHLLKDGKTLYHSGDANRPAWILNPADNSWLKAPDMRTEGGVK
jgi:hypothetical protein